MRTALLACVLLFATPRIAAACDDHELDAETRLSEMTERLIDRIESLEERLDGLEVEIEADIDVGAPDATEEPDAIDAPDEPADFDNDDDDA